MPTGTAVKTFNIEEGSIAGGYYQITVRFNGRIVKRYVEKRMGTAKRAFERDGFQPVAWAEGKRIVLQGE